MEKRFENDEMEIDLLEIFYILRSKILIIILTGIIFGAAAFGYAGFLATPSYTSSSMMLVLTKETTLSSLADLQIGSQLTKDYSILITSKPVLNDVIDNLDLDMNYKQLRDCITVNNESDTRILQISVEYPNAKKAKEIVDELSTVSSEYIGDKMEVTPPKIIEKGEASYERTDLSVKKTIAIGALLGMILCAAIVIVRALMDDSICVEEDIEKYLGISTLSVIPDRKDYINGSGKKMSKM